MPLSEVLLTRNSIGKDEFQMSLAKMTFPYTGSSLQSTKVAVVSQGSSFSFTAVGSLSKTVFGNKLCLHPVSTKSSLSQAWLGYPIMPEILDSVGVALCSLGWPCLFKHIGASRFPCLCLCVVCFSCSENMTSSEIVLDPLLFGTGTVTFECNQKYQSECEFAFLNVVRSSNWWFPLEKIAARPMHYFFKMHSRTLSVSLDHHLTGLFLPAKIFGHFFFMFDPPYTKQDRGFSQPASVLLLTRAVPQSHCTDVQASPPPAVQVEYLWKPAPKLPN